MTREEIVGLIGTANVLLPQITTLVSLGAFAIDQLWGIWSERNPGKTFEEFIADLRSNAAELKDVAGDALKARGFVQAADGSWYKPLG